MDIWSTNIAKIGCIIGLELNVTLIELMAE